MKLVKLIKSFPFLTALIIIIFFNINNKNEYAKLKILIWETPSLSLGSLITLSSFSGFILSYLITSNLVNLNKSNKNTTINYKSTINENVTKELDIQNNLNTYENTLIERDIKDPSPTINASFRVIGSNYTKNSNFINKENVVNDNLSYSDQYKESNYYDEERNDQNNMMKKFNDWDDNSFESW